MRQFQAGKRDVRSLAFTTDGRSLVWAETYGHHPKAVYWLDPRTGDTQRTLDLQDDAWRQRVPYPASSRWTSGAFVSPDGRWVAVRRYMDRPDLLDLWDGRTGEWSLVDPGEHPFVTYGVCYSAGSELLAFATSTAQVGARTASTRAVERLDLASGQMLPSVRIRDRAPARHLRLSADERLLAVDSSGGVAVLPHDRGRTDPGDPVELDFDGDDTAIEFSPGGEELAIRVGTGLLLWNCRSPEALELPLSGEEIWGLAYAPDGRLLALSCRDGGVLLYDRQRRQIARRYDWRIGAVYALAFAPDGLTLAAGGEGGRVVVWDVDG